PGRGRWVCDSRIPKRVGTNAVRLMALNAIGSEVGTNSIFQTPGGVGGGGQSAQRMNARDLAGEVTGLIESSDLIIGDATVIEFPIELPRVEAEGPTGHLRMTSQTFLATGIVPYLRVSFALLLDINVFVQAFFGYEGGVGLRFIP